ncbi:ATP-binding cassette domain-containing protein [Candidatus Acetothermia bacterium]|jgi:ABC-type multidrug transport system ATPase subunit|nr:ATP-binding cassette domain-containing protein [Candidatus Acetothermia bacterium]MCI2428927.1 ATP-binding cassette domain-containing protein [Candidatus Acetothermia bacterium]
MDNLTDEVLVLEQVVKSYGKVAALSGLNLSVREGEILGLVGSDGAGKTTALKIMATLLKPDSGVVQICGVNAQTESNEAKRAISYLPDLPLLYETLTVFETLKVFARAWSLKFSEAEALEILDGYGLRGLSNHRVKRLSKVQQQRLSLLCALLHNPRILLLDEPFTGLDVEGRDFLRKKIGELEQAGKTMVISSHDLRDVEKLCDTIAIIVEGRIVSQRKLSKPDKTSPLTKREIEILKLLALSKSNREIAEELYLSEETVKSHIKKIFRKLGFKSRTEAGSYFWHRD